MLHGAVSFLMRLDAPVAHGQMLCVVLSQHIPVCVEGGGSRGVAPNCL
jgi:hypothetical protein